MYPRSSGSTPVVETRLNPAAPTSRTRGGHHGGHRHSSPWVQQVRRASPRNESCKAQSPGHRGACLDDLGFVVSRLSESNRRPVLPGPPGEARRVNPDLRGDERSRPSAEVRHGPLETARARRNLSQTWHCLPCPTVLIPSTPFAHASHLGSDERGRGAILWRA